MKTACSMNFRGAIKVLNNLDDFDLMEQEQLEYLIDSNEGSSKLIISLCLDKCVNFDF